MLAHAHIIMNDNDCDLLVPPNYASQLAAGIIAGRLGPLKHKCRNGGNYR